MKSPYMVPKPSKGKGVSSLSHGSKRPKRTSEEEQNDMSSLQQPLRRYGLCWVTEKEDRSQTLGLNFVFNALGDCNLNMGHQIEEEETDYRPVYDQRGIDMTKTKELEGVYGPLLSVNECNARIDNMLSHLVGPGFEEPLDDGVSTEDEMARVDSDIEYSDVEEEDSEMGEAALAPTDDEECRPKEFFFHS
ncbi:hypothetical protein HAX54_041640 [Datura stramonium]|uniref:Uncharacterized protein n=1 Tax=Datura stramonium TaxID=4076 RepID=A0ABS8W0F4_DATST|nr:hypothetical protein [Datura stramonium]